VPGKLAPGATGGPTPSPGATLQPAETATRVVPARVYIRQYLNANQLAGALAGLYKVSLPTDPACEDNPTGLGSTSWHYSQNPNSVVGQLRCFTVTNAPRVLWTYTDKTMSARGEADSGKLPGLVRWWTTN